MPDDVKARMLLAGDFLSKDKEIEIVGKEMTEDKVSLKLKIGDEDSVVTVSHDTKLPIYNYD